MTMNEIEYMKQLILSTARLVWGECTDIQLAKTSNDFYCVMTECESATELLPLNELYAYLKGASAYKNTYCNN